MPVIAFFISRKLDARNPPSNPPTIPMIVTPNRPYLGLLKNWLASQPAIKPTTIQDRMPMGLLLSCQYKLHYRHPPRAIKSEVPYFPGREVPTQSGEAFSYGIDRRFYPGCHIELGKYDAHVFFDGFLADLQFRGNGQVCFSFHDQAQNCQLSGG